MSAAYSAATAAVIESAATVDRPLERRVLSLSLAPGFMLLRNIGGRPLRFRGELLAEGSSRTGDAVAWHEVAIYRTDADQIAVALRLLRSDVDDFGVHRAKLFDDLDGAASWLEAFDSSADLSADFDVADQTLTTATVTLRAASLRERAERVKRAYLGLVGELLFRLEAEL